MLYDRLEIVEFSTVSEKGPLTIADMKDALGWETESEFVARKMRERPGTKPEQWKWSDDGVKREDTDVIQPIHCKTLTGERVVCWNNANNRPFDADWCEDLIHTILSGQWAGPFTIPGETINGETIRISKYGRVLSGQHQMTACILAGEKLLKARNDGNDPPTDPKYPIWVKHGEPFLETVVVRGMSEHPKVLMSIDYNKPRTAADVFYTSEVFRESTPAQRRELCKMLEKSSDLLWTRTDTKGYRTHPEMVAFVERHKRILDCVMHVFNINKPTDKGGRKISALRLNPGHCAAIMYLMGCGSQKTTEYSDDYRNENPPSEKRLDWSLWDKAKEFWALLAGGRDFLQVRTALGRLVDSTPNSEKNQGLGGRTPEKFCLLSEAWARWKDHPASAGPPFDQADLEPGGILYLNYSDLDADGKKLPDNQVELVDTTDFMGIDCPEKSTSKRPDTSEPMPSTLGTQAEIQAAMDAAAKRRGQVVGVDAGPANARFAGRK